MNKAFTVLELIIVISIISVVVLGVGGATVFGIYELIHHFGS